MEKVTKKKKKIVALGIIAALVLGIAIVSYKLDNTQSSAFSIIDGIECNTQEYLVLHIHAHLDLFENGHYVTVPAQIGIHDNTCLYWLHTHSADGVIHIESPSPKEFTLGQFIDIWRDTSVGAPPANEEPIIYVNGQVVTTSLTDTKLNAHDEIVLAYGNPPQNIPSTYQFPQGE
jgi:hypothetical protein